MQQLVIQAIAGFGFFIDDNQCGLLLLMFHGIAIFENFHPADPRNARPRFR